MTVDLLQWNSIFFHLFAFQWQLLLKFSMLFKKCYDLPTASCSYLASFIIQAALVSVSRRDISLRILQAARAEATPSRPCRIERGAAVTLHRRAFLNGKDSTMQHTNSKKFMPLKKRLQYRFGSRKCWSKWQVWWFLRIETTSCGCPIPGNVWGQAGWDIEQTCLVVRGIRGGGLELGEL